MRFDIHSAGLAMSRKAKTWVQGKLQSLLDRFASKVRRVAVLGRDVNGPRGGLGVKCRLIADVDRFGPVIASAVDTSWPRAFGKASARLKNSVGRAVERSRRFA